MILNVGALVSVNVTCRSFNNPRGQRVKKMEASTQFSKCGFKRLVTQAAGGPDVWEGSLITQRKDETADH